MGGSPFAIIDANKAEQFALLGRGSGVLDDYELSVDADGVPWAVATVYRHRFGFTWPGDNRMFDPYARAARATQTESNRNVVAAADRDRHLAELTAVRKSIRLGGTAERLLWLIHKLVLAERTSLLTPPDVVLRDAVWGKGRSFPTHWRGELKAVLKGLACLHLDAGEGESESGPGFGDGTALLTHAADLRGKPEDVCGPECESGPSRHSHFLINVGRGFLGVLESFGTDSGDGVRSYLFPVGKPVRRKPSRGRNV